MREQKAAVIGLGFVGRAHVEGLRRLGIPIQGVMDVSREVGETIAKSLGLERVYGSLEEIVNDASVSVVHICTPNYLHFEMACALIEGGKHVICEKPLAMTSQEGAKLVKQIKDKRRCGAVNYNLRYYPLCQEARALIEKGVIGEPRLIHGSYLQDWLFYPTDWNWRLDPMLGGDLRAVADIGTHWMDLVMWMTQTTIESVCADLVTVLPTRRKPRREIETFLSKIEAIQEFDEVEVHTEDYAAILLRFNNRAHGVFTVSQVSAGRKNRLWFEIDGSEGSLSWDSENPNELWIGHRNKPNEFIIKDPALMQERARKYAAYPGGHAEGYPDTFVQLFKEFYTYVSKEEFDAPCPFPTFEDGWRELVLCEAIHRSATEARWVNI
jgi:predicted dehydrogenase